MQFGMTTESLVLGALVRGEGYGLEVARRIEDGGHDRPSASSVNRILRSLEAEGLVERRRGEPLAARGGRPRIYYSLTAEGSLAARHAGRLASEFAGWATASV